MSYNDPMKITHQTVLGEDGQPTAAIIPWNVFLAVQKEVGEEEDNFTSEEIAQINEASEDFKNDNRNSFVSISDVKARLGI